MSKAKFLLNFEELTALQLPPAVLRNTPRGIKKITARHSTSRGEKSQHTCGEKSFLLIYMQRENSIFIVMTFVLFHTLCCSQVPQFYLQVEVIERGYINKAEST